jgi:hypothetical protein
MEPILQEQTEPEREAGMGINANGIKMERIFFSAFSVVSS